MSGLPPFLADSPGRDSGMMMLEYLGHQDEANAIERAVVAAIDANETTNDLGGSLGTKSAGEAVLKRL